MASQCSAGAFESLTSRSNWAVIGQHNLPRVLHFPNARNRRAPGLKSRSRNCDLPSQSRQTISASSIADSDRSSKGSISFSTTNDLHSFPLHETSLHLPYSILARRRNPFHLAAISILETIARAPEDSRPAHPELPPRANSERTHRSRHKSTVRHYARLKRQPTSLQS